MTKSKTLSPVGVDSVFTELFPGDEICDSAGRHYTVDEQGRAKPLDGGNSIPLKYIKDAMTVKAADRIKARMDEITAKVEAYKSPKPTVVPKVEDLGPTSVKPSDFNGKIRLFHILARKSGYGAGQLRDAAVAGGLRVLKNGMFSGIAEEDVDRLLSLMTPATTKKAPVSGAKKKNGPSVRKSRETAESEKETPKRPDLSQFSDEELGIELKRRGWEFDAIKRMQV